MTLKDYKKLHGPEMRFVEYDGQITRYWDRKNEAPYNSSEQRKAEYCRIMSGQWNINFDYQNIIILFPLATGYGESVCYGNSERDVVIDHCTFYLDVKNFLAKKGVKYKNNIKMTNQKYSQTGFAMLVVQDGIAYAFETANPLNPSGGYRDSFREIKYDSTTDKHVKFNDKEIVFSGFFVYHIREIDDDAKKSFSRIFA